VSKRKSFLKKKRKTLSSDVALQITSMADIFMILLVFLLKSYASSVTNVAPTAHLSLPEITKAKSQIKDTLKIEIAGDTVMIDQKPVANLKNFQFEESDSAPGGASASILKFLSDQRKMRPEPNTESSLIVMADQQAPYSTIKRVVASAAGAGFVDLQLVVVETE
jgi:biopolymer transport protein ExbD